MVEKTIIKHPKHPWLHAIAHTYQENDKNHDVMILLSGVTFAHRQISLFLLAH